MRDLNYQLKLLCKHSHEGSFETRVGRERQLSAIANQLHDLGFRQLKATSLKQKHVQALVDQWLQQNLSPGTIFYQQFEVGFLLDFQVLPEH